MPFRLGRGLTPYRQQPPSFIPPALGQTGLGHGLRIASANPSNGVWSRYTGFVRPTVVTATAPAASKTARFGKTAVFSSATTAFEYTGIEAFQWPLTYLFTIRETAQPAQGSILSFGGSGDSQGWELSQSSKTFQLTFGNVANYSIQETDLVEPDVDYHCVMVIEQGLVRVHYNRADGTPQTLRSVTLDTAVGNILLPAGKPLTLGAAYNPVAGGYVGPSQCHLGAFALWDRALQLEEIHALLDNPYQIWVEPTYGRWSSQSVNVEFGLSENLLIWSEDFTNAHWVKGRASITADATTAPDGATTADKFFEDTTNGGHSVWDNTTVCDPSTTYVHSVYAKAAERTFVRVRIGTDIGFLNDVLVDLSTGTVSNPNADNGVEDVGNGWYRLWVRGTTQSTATRFNNLGTILRQSSGVESYLGDGVSGVYLWGEQLNLGEDLLRYVKTEDTTISTPGRTPPNAGTGAVGTTTPHGKASTSFTNPTAMTGQRGTVTTTGKATAPVTGSAAASQLGTILINNENTGFTAVPAGTGAVGTTTQSGKGRVTVTGIQRSTALGVVSVGGEVQVLAPSLLATAQQGTVNAFAGAGATPAGVVGTMALGVPMSFIGYPPLPVAGMAGQLGGIATSGWNSIATAPDGDWATIQAGG